MYSLKILVPLLLLQCASLALAFNGRCPSSWAHYNQSCYKVFETRKNYVSALSSCEDFGASLVSISNENENDFVTGLCRGHGSMWIGLNDISEEGVFQWTDGTQFRYNFDYLEEDGGSGWTPCKSGRLDTYCKDAELDFSNWLRTEPNNGQSEDCASFLHYKDGRWTEMSCARKKQYICEMDAETEGTINETTIKCPHSFETILELGSSPSKIVFWTDPLYLQSDSSITVERSHSSGDRFPPGVTWVNYTVYDVHSPGMVTCNFSVTLLELDTTRPKVVWCPDDFTMTKMHNLPLTVKWPPPTATDLTNITTTSSHSPGGKFKTGVTNVVYKFTDESGNSAYCSFEIYVIEVNTHSGPSAITIGNSDKVNRLVVGLCVTLCFIGFILVLHLVLKIVRRRRFNISANNLIQE